MDDCNGRQAGRPRVRDSIRPGFPGTVPDLRALNIFVPQISVWDAKCPHIKQQAKLQFCMS